MSIQPFKDIFENSQVLFNLTADQDYMFFYSDEIDGDISTTTFSAENRFYEFGFCKTRTRRKSYIEEIDPIDIGTHVDNGIVCLVDVKSRMIYVTTRIYTYLWANRDKEAIEEKLKIYNKIDATYKNYNSNYRRQVIIYHRFKISKKNIERTQAIFSLFPDIS